MGWIRNWKDKRFKKRLERVLNNNVLSCNIDIEGHFCYLGKDLAKSNGGTGGGKNDGKNSNHTENDNLIVSNR